MKIAMLGHKRIPSREGGVEIVVEELATRMVQRGHDVTCYNRKGKHVMDKSIEENHLSEYKGIHLKSVLTIDKKGLSAMSASFFASIQAAFSNCDVVHFHAEGPCATLWIPKLFGKRCIATIHGLDHQRAKWGKLASTYIMMGEKCAVKYAEEIIVLSKGVQEYFQKTYGRKTVFIPNGVNKPSIIEANLIKKRFKLNKNDYILYLGRIVPEKGIHYLIEAYSQIKTDKKLVIAGGSSDTDEYLKELKKMANHNKNIVFTGFVQGQILDELYSNAYIYCLPSDLEGMPLSLLEAMSYGNCCLVSDIEECSSVVDDKAVIFKKSDVEDLKNKLTSLVNDSQLVNKYKEEAADYILSKYDWDKVTDKTLGLYESNKKY